MKTQDSYGAISAKLGSRTSRKVGNNTYLLKQDAGTITLRLHATDILTFHPDGRTVASSGGWKTATTKARLNDYLPHGWSISQRNGAWFWWRWNEGKRGWDAHGEPFTDGDSIGPRGKLNAQGTAEDAKAKARQRRKILAFARLCADAVPLPQPGPGDCFFCQFQTEDGQSLGDATDKTGHLLSHVEEGYAVPSLVARAMKEAGNTQMVTAAAFQQKQDVGFLLGIAKDSVRRAVASFIFRRLGMVAKGGWGNAKGFAVR